jgi:hypothetical protein
MIFKFSAPLIILIFGCQSLSNDHTFNPAKFSEDLKALKLEQVVTSADGKHFLAVFYNESRSMSGIKVVKLYGADSISVDEAFYGAHPLQVENWKDSVIIFNAGVFSAHGDSAARKRYLDGSVDRNTSLGKYKISYLKNYNTRP